MQVVKTFPNKTSTDLSNYDGYVVKYDTSGLNICSAITDKAVGVIVKGGETESDVCIFGECRAKAGGAVTRACHVTPHTDGTVIVTAASSQEFALALETGIAGDWVELFILGLTLTNT